MKGHPRFLVLRGGAIGDFVLTLPVLQALREQWPDSHIEVAGYPHIAILAQAGGWADRIVSLHSAHFARFYSLRPALGEELAGYVRSFDLVVSFLHDTDGVVRRNLLSTGVRQVLYASPVGPTIHASDHLIKPLESLAIYAAGTIPRLTLPETDRATGRARLASLGLSGRTLALHPGSGSAEKNWPARHFHALAGAAADRGWSPFFIFGEADEAVAAALRMLDERLPVIEGLELIETAGVLAVADGFVGNDSGITHLAAALGRPTVALFGPTDPAVWGPRGSCVRVLRAPDGRLAGILPPAVLDALISVAPPEPPPAASPARPPPAP
jgi:heptosyltransferase-2